MLNESHRESLRDSVRRIESRLSDLEFAEKGADTSWVEWDHVNRMPVVHSSHVERMEAVVATMNALLENMDRSLENQNDMLSPMPTESYAFSRSFAIDELLVPEGLSTESSDVIEFDELQRKHLANGAPLQIFTETLRKFQLEIGHLKEEIKGMKENSLVRRLTDEVDRLKHVNYSKQDEIEELKRTVTAITELLEEANKKLNEHEANRFGARGGDVARRDSKMAVDVASKQLKEITKLQSQIKAGLKRAAGLEIRVSEVEMLLTESETRCKNSDAEISKMHATYQKEIEAMRSAWDETKRELADAKMSITLKEVALMQGQSALRESHEVAEREKQSLKKDLEEARRLTHAVVVLGPVTSPADDVVVNSSDADRPEHESSSPVSFPFDVSDALPIPSIRDPVDSWAEVDTVVLPVSGTAEDNHALLDSDTVGLHDDRDEDAHVPVDTSPEKAIEEEEDVELAALAHSAGMDSFPGSAIDSESLTSRDGSRYHMSGEELDRLAALERENIGLTQTIKSLEAEIAGMASALLASKNKTTSRPVSRAGSISNPASSRPTTPMATQRRLSFMGRSESPAAAYPSISKGAATYADEEIMLLQNRIIELESLLDSFIGAGNADSGYNSVPAPTLIPGGRSSFIPSRYVGGPTTGTSPMTVKTYVKPMDVTSMSSSKAAAMVGVIDYTMQRYRRIRSSFAVENWGALVKAIDIKQAMLQVSSEWREFIEVDKLRRVQRFLAHQLRQLQKQRNVMQEAHQAQWILNVNRVVDMCAYVFNNKISQSSTAKVTDIRHAKVRFTDRDAALDGLPQHKTLNLPLSTGSPILYSHVSVDNLLRLKLVMNEIPEDVSSMTRESMKQVIAEAVTYIMEGSREDQQKRLNKEIHSHDAPRTVASSTTPHRETSSKIDTSRPTTAPAAVQNHMVISTPYERREMDRYSAAVNLKQHASVNLGSTGPFYAPNPMPAFRGADFHYDSRKEKHLAVSDNFQLPHRPVTAPARPGKPPTTKKSRLSRPKTAAGISPGLASEFGAGGRAWKVVETTSYL